MGNPKVRVVQRRMLNVPGFATARIAGEGVFAEVSHTVEFKPGEGIDDAVARALNEMGNFFANRGLSGFSVKSVEQRLKEEGGSGG